MKQLLLLFLCLTSPLAAYNVWCNGPLCQCDLSVAIKGGGAPTFTTHRGATLLTTGAGTIQEGRIRDFGGMFDLPWTLGLEIALNLSSRIQFLFEYAIYEAQGKCKPRLFNGEEVAEQLFEYQSNNFYLGLRYYFNRWCLPCTGTPIAPYIGAKGGVAVQQAVNHSILQDGRILGTTTYFRAREAASGSLFVGTEWWFAGRLSFLFQLEAMATGGLHPERNALYEPPVLGVLRERVGSTDLLISFPITLALRYTF